MWRLLVALALPLAADASWQLARVPRTRARVVALTEARDEWDQFTAWAEEDENNRQKVETVAVKKALRRQSVTSRGHLHDHFFSKSAHTFGELGATERLQSNCARLGATHPSCAQAASFGPIARGSDCVLAHAPGTGKTLAFVAPLVQRLWEWEEADGRTPEGEVRALIIVPTAELAQQVVTLAREVAQRSIRASVATGEHSWSTQRSRLRSGLDLLVATMGRLVAHLHPRGRMEPSVSLRGLRAVIVDEADSLYSGEAPSWLSQQRGSSTAHGLRQEPPLAMWRWLRSELPSGCSTTLVTATLPEAVEEQMRDDVGSELRVLRGRGLHQTRSGLDITLVDCSQPTLAADGRISLFETKFLQLLDELRASPERRTLVLCNTAATCERLAKGLARTRAGAPLSEERSPRVLRFHSSLVPEKRRSALAAFTRPPAEGTLARAGPPRILVSTGRAARGLELTDAPYGLNGAESGGSRAPSPVGHVILFDFPPDASTYLARVGFAARGGQPAARVTALAIGKQLPFAKAMLAHEQDGKPLRLD